MRIVVVGAGEVGYYIAQSLIREKHDLIIVDKDHANYEKVMDELDVIAINGDGANPLVLGEVLGENTDFIISVTNDDLTNIISCLIAKKCGVPRAIARINDPIHLENPLLNEEEGIQVFYPEQVVSNEINRVINIPFATDVEYFAEGKVEMIRVKVSEKSQLLGKALKNVKIPNSWILLALIRPDSLIVPSGDTEFKYGDWVLALGRTSSRTEIQDFMGVQSKPVEKVVVMGGGRISEYFASRLVQQKITVRAIIPDKDAAEDFAKKIPKALVLKGEYSSLLKDAGVANCDYFVALTREDEANILLSLLAKEQGAKRAIALSRKPQYNQVIKHAGIDMVVSPHLSTASEILRFVRSKELLFTAIVEEGKGEVIEFEAKKGSKVIDKPLSKVGFPANSIVGTIVKGKEVIIPRGNSVIGVGDRVIVFSLPNVVKKLIGIFSGR